MIMAVTSPQVELLISLFFSEDDVNFSYVSYISTSGITTLHTQDIFLEKIKNHANNLIGDLMHYKGVPGSHWLFMHCSYTVRLRLYKPRSVNI